MKMFLLILNEHLIWSSVLIILLPIFELMMLFFADWNECFVLIRFLTLIDDNWSLDNNHNEGAVHESLSEEQE